MFSALPTVDHEQVLRAFVSEGAIVRYLKEQAASKRGEMGERRSHRLGVRFADFYYTPNQHYQEGTLPPIGRYFLSSYCGNDTTPRIDARLLGILGVGLQQNGRRREGGVQPLDVVPQVTEGDMQELEAPLIQTTGRILTILDVVRTVLFGKGLLTTSSGSPMGRPNNSNTFDNHAYTDSSGGRSAPLCEATVTIRRRLFPGMLPVPILEENNSSDSDGEEEHITLGPCDGLVHDNDARLRAALESAYSVAKDEFQCSDGGGIRSSAARSYIVRSVAYMRRIRDGSVQGKECADDTEKSGGFLWEVVRTCQECVTQLEDLDKTYMFSSARDEFHECVGDIGPDGPTTENVLVVCGEEVKTSFAFFQDAAHSLYSWAMNCIEMINSYEQQGLLPRASPARRSHTVSDTKTLTSKDDNDSDSEEAMPLTDVSSSYLPLEDRAQSMYEYPLSAVTTQNVPLSEITSALADAIRYPPVMRPDCPLTARLNESCAVYVSGQRLLSVPYFSSIRQLIQTVERETDRLNRPPNDTSVRTTRLSPPPSRFQFLLDTLRLYYIASVTADEKKTLEHFSSVTMALLSELAAERTLMEANRNSILTSLQARWEAKKEARGGGEVAEVEEEEYYLPDPLLPLYTRDEKDTLNVSFGAFFRTRSAIRGLIGALQKDIMRRNRTHGVVMVTATPTASSSSRSGVFSASVVPLVVRHYRASKGKSQPVDVRSRPTVAKQQIPMENTSVRTVSAMESDENYFQGTDASSSSLFVSPRHFYESGKNFLSRQGSRLPALKVPLPTSTLAEWKRLVVEVPVVVRRRVEAGCSTNRAEAGEYDGDKRGGSTYPVSMVPVRAAVPLDSADLPPTELASPDLAAELEENTTAASTSTNEGWGFLSAVVGAWQKFSCSLTPNSQEVQDARRAAPPTPDPVFKGPPKSVVSPLVYRKEALLIALIDADNEAQRMHEALSAEYPTLYASGSNFASAERMKGASTRFASAFMPPATAAAEERDGAVVDGIMGATDRIITTIQTRTRALLDLAEVRKGDDVDPKTGAPSQPTLLAHVAKVAQQYSIVFDPPK